MLHGHGEDAKTVPSDSHFEKGDGPVSGLLAGAHDWAGRSSVVTAKVWPRTHFASPLHSLRISSACLLPQEWWFNGDVGVDTFDKQLPRGAIRACHRSRGRSSTSNAAAGDADLAFWLSRVTFGDTDGVPEGRKPPTPD